MTRPVQRKRRENGKRCDGGINFLANSQADDRQEKARNMPKNECGIEVPTEVAKKAEELGCVQGVKYVYRDGEYEGKMPVASLSCKRATRFYSDRYDHYKVVLARGWVAFRSPSSNPRCAFDGISPPLRSRIGEITRRKKIDGTPLVYRVEDDVAFLAESNSKKAFCLQKIRLDDGQGFDNGHLEFRIFYYMIIHKDRGKGRWGFGESAPMMTAHEMSMVVETMRNKGWLPA